MFCNSKMMIAVIIFCFIAVDSTVISASSSYQMCWGKHDALNKAPKSCNLEYCETMGKINICCNIICTQCIIKEAEKSRKNLTKLRENFRAKVSSLLQLKSERIKKDMEMKKRRQQLSKDLTVTGKVRTQTHAKRAPAKVKPDLPCPLCPEAYGRRAAHSAVLFLGSDTTQFDKKTEEKLKSLEKCLRERDYCVETCPVYIKHTMKELTAKHRQPKEFKKIRMHRRHISQHRCQLVCERNKDNLFDKSHHESVFQKKKKLQGYAHPEVKRVVDNIQRCKNSEKLEVTRKPSKTIPQVPQPPRQPKQVITELLQKRLYAKRFANRGNCPACRYKNRPRLEAHDNYLRLAVDKKAVVVRIMDSDQCGPCLVKGAEVTVSKFINNSRYVEVLDSNGAKCKVSKRALRLLLRPETVRIVNRCLDMADRKRNERMQGCPVCDKICDQHNWFNGLKVVKK